MMKVIGMCFSYDALLSSLGHHKDESSYVAGTYVYIYIYIYISVYVYLSSCCENVFLRD